MDKDINLERKWVPESARTPLRCEDCAAKLVVLKDDLDEIIIGCPKCSEYA